jgi:hypothetical protein
MHILVALLISIALQPNSTAQVADAAPPPRHQWDEAPSPPWNTPDGLLNATPDAVAALLGPPLGAGSNEQRSMLDYAGEECVLTVFFELRDHEVRSKMVAVVSPAGELTDPTSCLRTIKPPLDDLPQT